jgi:hypothetical protein
MEINRVSQEGSKKMQELPDIVPVSFEQVVQDWYSTVQWNSWK